MPVPIRLVLVRHGQSIWNVENLFTGWTDVDLSAQGCEEARQAGRELAREGVVPDVVFTSVLKRAIRTQWLMLDELDLLHIHGHSHYYESHGPRDHIHVACLRCGKVREVESELFEDLKRQVQRDTGIAITVTRMEIGGYCDSCRR